jgi:hypothetical protein
MEPQSSKTNEQNVNPYLSDTWDDALNNYHDLQKLVLQYLGQNAYIDHESGELCVDIIWENLDDALQMRSCTDVYEVVIEPLMGLGYLHPKDKYWGENRTWVEVFSLSTPRPQWGNFRDVMERMEDAIY